MGDLIERGSRWLGGMLTKHASKTVVYRRGEQAVNVNATKQRTEYEIDRNGLVETFVATDFSIAAAELVLSTGRVTPQPGDQVWELMNQTTVIYEVLNPGGDRQCFEADEFGHRLRIHTKEVDTL